jgi:hypothetical protein
MDLNRLFNTPLNELFGRRRPPIATARPDKPRQGATLCCAGLRMPVQAGMSDEMWNWMVGLGWRELRSGENRLHYQPLPSTLVARLYDVAAEDRQRVLVAAIREATRPREVRAERTSHQ